MQLRQIKLGMYYLCLILFAIHLAAFSTEAGHKSPMEPISWTLKSKAETSADLALETFGPALGPTILLISGAGAPAAFWPDDFARRLVTAGFRVVRFDHRDTGASTHFDKPYAIDTLVRDVANIIAALNTEKLFLVGHSMGGYIVEIIASDPNRHQSVVAAAALSAGPTSNPERYAEFSMSVPSEEVWQTLMQNMPSDDYTSDLPGWMQTWRYLNGDRDFDPALAQNYTAALYKGDARNHQVAENHIYAMSTVPTDLPERLTQTTLPLLVIHGDRDPLVPLNNGLATHTLAKGSELKVLNGAGHMFFDKSLWADLAAALAGFFEKQA